MKALSMIKKLPVRFGLTADEKKAILAKVFEAGGEGIIMKHRLGTYVPNERRPNAGTDLWLKQKKKISNALGGDNPDAFVTGFIEGTKGTANEGLVAGLEFSVYLVPSGRVHVLGRCSNFTREQRIEMTTRGEDGSVALNPLYYNRVAEITGMDVSSTLEHGKGALVHCQFRRWRGGIDGKSPEQCTFPEHLLNEAVL